MIFEKNKVTFSQLQDFMVIAYGASDRESFASSLGYNFLDRGCEETVMAYADDIDNDCDGIIDEEICGDGLDNDGDNLLDEDCKGKNKQ